MNTLQAVLDIAVMIETQVGQLLAVIDLAQAYDRVIRQLLIDKLSRYGVPENLINQLIIFLLLLLARTVGDIMNTMETFTTRFV